MPCVSTTKGDNEKRKGVRLTITNSLSTGKKQTNILSPGSGSSTLATAQALWGSKALETVTEFALSLSIEGPRPRLSASNSSIPASVVARYVSSPAVICISARWGTDHPLWHN